MFNTDVAFMSRSLPHNPRNLDMNLHLSENLKSYFAYVMATNQLLGQLLNANPKELHHKKSGWIDLGML
jgi:hypothetical protein